MVPSHESTGAGLHGADEIFAVLGLASTELRAYQFLLRAGAATPTTVARETAQSRGRIYETLRILVEKGLAREEPTRPIQYIPVPLAEVLAIAMAETNRRAQALRTAYGSLPQIASPAQPPAPPTRPSDIAVFSGRPSVAAEIRRMIARSADYFLLRGGGHLAERLAASPLVLRELRDAASRKVRVEVHVPASSAANARQLLALELGAERVRTLPPGDAPALVTAVNEAGALLVAVQPDDDVPLRGDDVAVLAGGSPFVREMARGFGAAPESPRDDAPRPAASVPEPTPPAEFDAHAVGLRFLEALSGARSEVVAMGPRGWGEFLRQGWQVTLGAYAGAKRRGVRFRALTTDAPEERPAMEPFLAIYDIRVTAWIPVWLILVDGRHLFQAFAVGGAAGPPELRYSTEPTELRFYLDLFQRLWASARPLLVEAQEGPSPAAPGGG